MIPGRIVVGFYLALMLVGQVVAGSVIERTPAELLQGAERVVYGRVDDIATDEEGATVVTLLIERELSRPSETGAGPDPQATPTVRVVFGVGADGGRIADLPVPTSGDRVLWALNGDPGALSPIEGVWQGAWTVAAEGWIDLRGRILGLDGTVVRYGGPERDVEAVLDAVAAALSGGNAQFADEATSADESEPSLPSVPEPASGDGVASPEPVDAEADAFEIAVASADGAALRAALQDAVDLWTEAGVDLTLRFDDDADDRVIVADANELGPDALVLLRRLPERSGVDLLVRRTADGFRADALAQALGRLLGLPPRPSGFLSGLVPSDTLIRPSSVDASDLTRTLRSERGDLDGDGDVDLYDLATVAEAFGREGVALAADLDRSGRVDEADIDILRAAYDFLPASRQPPPSLDEEP